MIDYSEVINVFLGHIAYGHYQYDGRMKVFSRQVESLLPREKVLEAYEILYGRQLKEEDTINILMHEKDTAALRNKLILDDCFNPDNLEECNWGEMLVTRKDICLGYLYFLGRAPESEKVINSRILNKATRQQFFSSVISSLEFRMIYQQLTQRIARKYFFDNFLYKQELDIFNDLWA